MTPEEQITWTIATLKESVILYRLPEPRRRELLALLHQLEQQWEAYQAGTLAAIDTEGLEV